MVAAATNELAWTGQPILEITNGREYVLCPVCKDPNRLVGLRTSGWFDKRLGDVYVHKHCLSVERKLELGEAPLEGLFSELSAAETERLAVLLEECGEVAQVVGKIQRFGYESRDPDTGLTNRMLLEKELADVRVATNLLVKTGDVMEESLQVRAEEKRKKLLLWLKHQNLDYLQSEQSANNPI